MIHSNVVYSQTTTFTYTGLTNACPPVNTKTGSATGLTFSDITKGSGVSCTATNNAINGSTFNVTLANAIAGAKWYTFNITSNSTTAFVVNSLSIVSQVSVSTGSPNVSIQYSLGGTTPTTVIGSYTPTQSSVTYTIVPKTAIYVPAGTVLNIYIIPNTLTASGTTCRVSTNTSITVTTQPPLALALTPGGSSANQISVAYAASKETGLYRNTTTSMPFTPVVGKYAPAETTSPSLSGFTIPANMDFMLEYWVKQSAPTSNEGWEIGLNTINTGTVDFDRNTSTNIRWIDYTTGTVTTGNYTTPTMVADVYEHIRIVRKGTTYYEYFNDIPAAIYSHVPTAGGAPAITSVQFANAATGTTTWKEIKIVQLNNTTPFADAGGADITAPNLPTSLNITPTVGSSSSLDLSWASPSDNGNTYYYYGDNIPGTPTGAESNYLNIPNASFETGVLSPWTTYQSPTGGVTFPVAATPNMFNDGYAASMTSATAGSQGAVYIDVPYINNPWTIGQQYIVSCWAKAAAGTTGTFNMTADEGGPGYAANGASATSTPSTSNWQQYSFIATPTTASMRILLWFNGTGTVYMDNVQVRALYSATQTSGLKDYYIAQASGTPIGTGGNAYTTSSPKSVSGLSANTQYCFTLAARDNGNNQSAATTQVCKYTNATIPTTFTANPSTAPCGGIDLAWSGGAWTTVRIRNTTTGLDVYTGSATSFQDFPLTQGQNYSYELYAINGDGLENSTPTSTVSTTVYTCGGPTIDNISPVFACAGSGATITISGSNLGGGTVTVNGFAATVTSSSNTQLQVTLPPTAVGQGNIEVTTFGPQIVTSTQTFTVNPLATAGTFQYANGSSENICTGTTISCADVASPTNGGGMGTLKVVWYCGQLISGAPGSGTYGNYVASVDAGISNFPLSNYLLTAVGGVQESGFALSAYNPLNDFTTGNTTNFILIRRAYTSECGVCIASCIDQKFYLNLQTPASDPTDITGAITLCASGTNTLSIHGGSDGSGATYEWFSEGCGSGSVLGTGSTFTTPTITSNTTFYVRRVSNTTCTSITNCANQLVTVNYTPIVNAGPDQSSVPRGTAAQLAGSYSGASGVVWTSNVPGTFTPNNTTATATWLPTDNMWVGTATITLTTLGAPSPCSNVSSDVHITVGIPRFCPGMNNGSVTFTAGNGTGSNSYQISIDGGLTWNPYTSGNGINTDNATGDILIKTTRADANCSSTNTYTLCALNTSGCNTPIIASFYPTSGCAGSGTVTITGTYLSNTSAITVNGTSVPSAGIHQIDGSHVSFDIPAGTSGTGFIVVTTPSGSYSSDLIPAEFTVMTDATAPTSDAVTVSDNCWNLDNAHTYTITAYATENGSGIGGVEGSFYGISAKINGSGTNYGGFFSWNPLQTSLTSQGFTQNQIAATGGNAGGYAGVYAAGFGASHVTLVACQADYDAVNGQYTVVFTVQPNNTFPALATNEVSMYAIDNCGNASPWDFNTAFSSGLTNGGTIASTSVCSGTDGIVNLVGSIGAVEKWQYSEDGGLNWIDIANNTTSQTYTNIQTTTEYQVFVQNGNCSPVVSSIGTITVITAATVAPISAVSAICQGGTTAPLGGSVTHATGGTWTYSGGNGSFNPSATDLNATFTASSSSPSPITLTLTATGGCGTPAESTILTVNPLPTAIAGSAVAAVCQGQTTAVLGGSVGNGAISGIWSDGGVGGTFNNNGGSTPNTTTYTTSATSPASVTLTLTASTGLCSATASKTLTVNTAATLPSGNTNLTICTGQTANLNLTSTNNNIYWYNSSGTLLGTTASGVNFPVTPNATTTYYAESNSSISAGSQPFYYTGSNQTFTVPGGVNSITVGAWGGGGGGGAANTISAGGSTGGGGGGGAYSKQTWAVTPGQSYTITCGSAGAAGSNGGSGGTGGTTTVTGPSGTCSAAGGIGGSANTGTGGNGGTSGTGFLFSGGNGGVGFSGSDDDNGGAGGGGAGNAGNGSVGGNAAAGTTAVGGNGGIGNPNNAPYIGGKGGNGSPKGSPWYGTGSAGTSPGGGGGGAGSYGDNNSTKCNCSGGAGAAGQVVISWSAVNGCPSVSRVPVIVTVNSNPTVTVTPTSGSFCTPGGTTVSITASGADSYTWLPATGLSAYTGSNVIANPTSSTVYTVTGTIGTGCTATATANITVNSDPNPVTLTPLNTTICDGTVVDFALTCASSSPTIYSTNFDGTNNWTLAGNFAVGAPGASNVVTTANSSPNILATVLNGPYASNCTEAANNAISPTINCNDYTNVSLSFYSYSIFQTTGVDYGRVYVSNDNGATWSPSLQQVGATDETGWTLHTIDISAYANHKSKVKIKFTMVSNNSTNYTGWNIDNLTVSGASQVAYSWTSVPAGFTSSVQNPTATPNQTTEYIVAIQNYAGCTASANTTISVIPTPAAVSVTGGTTQCGGTATIVATGGEPGTIYFEGTTSNGTSTAIASSTETVSVTGPTYYFRSQNPNGCWGAQGSADVTIHTIPDPVYVTGGGTYCGSNTITATGGAGGTIYFEGTTSGGTSTATTATSQLINSLGTGTYYFRSWSGFCWGDEGSVTVTINPIPAAVTVSGGGVHCGETTLLATEGTGGTIFYQQFTSGGELTNIGFSPQTVYYSGNYYFRSISPEGCWGPQGEAVVTINPIPDGVSVTGSGTYCGSAPIIASGGTGGTIYFQGTTSGGTSQANPSNYENVTSSGNYYFVSISSEGCVGMESYAEVNVNPSPAPVTVTGGGTYCGSTILEAFGGEGGTILWQGTTQGGQSTDDATNPMAVSDPGTYTYFFNSRSDEDCWGTEGSATVTINEIPNPVIVTNLNTGVNCGSATLEASGGLGGMIYWQGTTSGGTSTAFAATTHTVTDLGTHTYYFRSYSGDCWGPEGSITVDITPAPLAPAGDILQYFCQGYSISDIAVTGTGILWYASAYSTTPLNSGTTLSDGLHYFASQTINGCESTSRLEVEIGITIPTAPDGPATQWFCVTDSPTVGQLTAYADVVRWYSDNIGGVPLDPSTPLEDGIHYYGTQTIFGCESPTRLDVLAIVNTTVPIVPITGGETAVCVNSTTTAFADATAGGTWSITNGTGTASIDNAGIVTGLSGGTITVNYTVASGSCTSTVTTGLYINPLPTVGPIKGIFEVCVGSTTLLSDVTSGGIWSSSNPTSASVSTDGLVSGLIAGNTIINYTVTDGNGCVNHTSQNVIVYPVYSFTEYNSICSRQIDTWHGQVLTSEGTYTALYTTIHGCDSIYTLHLTVNPTFAYTETHSICEGDTYVWHGQNLTLAGSHTASYTTVNGCDSTYTLYLTVNPLTTYTETHSICQGDTYVWYTQNLTTTGVYTANVTNGNGCEDTYNLTLTVHPLNTYPEIHSICQGDAYSWHGQSLTTAGDYIAYETNINGCVDTYTLTLTVNPASTFTETHSICQGETYVWHTQSLTTSGPYTAHETNINGCTDTYNLTLTVNLVYTHNETYSINEGETYVWHTQSLTTNGTFTAYETNSSGCQDTYILDLTVIPSTKTLTVKLFLESLYAGSGIMNQAKDISGPKFSTGIADTIRVELHDATTPFALAYSYPNLDLSTNGDVIINSVPGTITGSYYLVVRHRNSIETWSADAIDFAVASPINYDFTTSVSYAYGSNMKSMSGIFAIYAGDANQDGIVDGSDMAAIDNSSTAVMVGYYPEDLNGDGIVDASDMAIIDNNSTAVVSAIKP